MSFYFVSFPYIRYNILYIIHLQPIWFVAHNLKIINLYFAMFLRLSVALYFVLVLLFLTQSECQLFEQSKGMTGKVLVFHVVVKMKTTEECKFERFFDVTYILFTLTQLLKASSFVYRKGTQKRNLFQFFPTLTILLHKLFALSHHMLICIKM